MRTELEAADASWVAGAAPEWHGEDLGAKTRYRQADAACALTFEGDDAFALDFATPQWAVTPGQSAVVYRGDECLGGGVIR
jgi:tRNA-specific 2-thiouridylase